jgi:hypothetical protein
MLEPGAIIRVVERSATHRTTAAATREALLGRHLRRWIFGAPGRTRTCNLLFRRCLRPSPPVLPPSDQRPAPVGPLIVLWSPGTLRGSSICVNCSTSKKPVARSALLSCAGSHRWQKGGVCIASSRCCVPADRAAGLGTGPVGWRLPVCLVDRLGPQGRLGCWALAPGGYRPG